MEATLRAEPRSSRLALVFALLAGVVAGGLTARTQAWWYGTEILLAVVVGVLSVAPLVVRAWQGRLDVFEPLTLMCAVYLLFYCIGPLVWLISNDVQFVGRHFGSLYARGLLGVMIPILATWIGYSLPWGRRLGAWAAQPLALGEPGLRVLRRWGWGLAAGAVCGLLLHVATANVPLGRFFLPGLVSVAPQATEAGPGQEVGWFITMLEWLVPGFLLLAVSGGFRWRWMRWAYWLTVVIVFFSISFRHRLIIFLVATVALYYLRRARRPAPALLALGGGGLFILAGLVSILRRFLSSFGTAETDVRLGTILKSSITDTRIFETFMAVQYAVPRFVDYVYADPFLYVFILPLPRALWPAKPEPEWIRTIGPILGTPNAVEAGAAVPQFGEYYMAFGWPGVVMGMVVFGLVTRALWAWFQADPRDPARQVVFAIWNIWLLQVMIRGYLAQMVKEWAFFILPALLAMWMARRAQRRAMAVGRA